MGEREREMPRESDEGVNRNGMYVVNKKHVASVFTRKFLANATLSVVVLVSLEGNMIYLLGHNNNKTRKMMMTTREAKWTESEMGRRRPTVYGGN